MAASPSPTHMSFGDGVAASPPEDSPESEVYSWWRYRTEKSPLPAGRDFGDVSETWIQGSWVRDPMRPGSSEGGFAAVLLGRRPRVLECGVGLGVVSCYGVRGADLVRGWRLRRPVFGPPEKGRRKKAGIFPSSFPVEKLRELGASRLDQRSHAEFSSWRESASFRERTVRAGIQRYR